MAALAALLTKAPRGPASGAWAAAYRWLATGNNGKGASVKEPTYTYVPPGSSMREPIYISTSDPVYFVDPPVSGLQPEMPGAATPAGEEKAPPAAAPSSSSPSTSLPFHAISGAPKPNIDGKPVSHRMIDDLAQQQYVVSPNHSMRDPKYVSITEPAYVSDKKPASGGGGGGSTAGSKAKAGKQ